MSNITDVNKQASAKPMDVIVNTSAGPPFKVTVRKIFTNRQIAAINNTRLERV
jgi:hypothetical protein